MSGVPPPVIGSALQAGLAQRQASTAREAEEGRSDSANRIKAARTEEMQFTVETTDGEMRVNTEGGGRGGQGRVLTGEKEEEPEQQAPEGSGITVDPDGQLHLDLEA